MGKLTELRDELMRDTEFSKGYEQQSQVVRIGQMLRVARESQGLTQVQLAERLKISQSEISRLEKGEGINGPTFDTIVSVAHALKLQLVVGFSEAGQPASGESGRDPNLLRVSRARRGRHAYAGHDAGRGARAATENPRGGEQEALWSAF